jgi:lysozyme
MKIIDILQRLLNEQNRDPKNPESSPNLDTLGYDSDGYWTFPDWKDWFNSNETKYGKKEACLRFITQWEFAAEGFEDGEEEGIEWDNMKKWFKQKEMWNGPEDRPYTKKEFEDVLRYKEKYDDNSINLNNDLKDGSTMSVSQYDFFNHLKYSEGLKKESYADTGGVWTIGYGHTKGVKPNQTATEEQIRKWLLEDIVEFEECVRGIMSSWKKQGLKTYMITQGQFDAMVSFSFNAGCGGLRTSDFIQLTKQGKHEEAAQVMKNEKLTDKKGKKLRGLVIRRENESKMYLS